MLTRFLLYALLILFIVRAIARLVRGIARGMGGEQRREPIDSGTRMVRDPVCGTFILPTGTLAVRDTAGMHHFCSEKCRSAYLARATR